jgi:hypothetical protein
MATHLGWLFLGMLLRIIFPLASAKLVMPPNITELDTRFPTDCFNRTSFPPDFIFGVASSAYQVARLNLYLASLFDY